MTTSKKGCFLGYGPLPGCEAGRELFNKAGGSPEASPFELLVVLWELRGVFSKRRGCLLVGFNGGDYVGNGMDVALCGDGEVGWSFLPLCVSIPLLRWEILGTQIGLFIVSRRYVLLWGSLVWVIRRRPWLF